MILDERGEFCDATALNTGAPARYLVGDVIDTTGGLAGNPLGRDLGHGYPVYFVLVVTTSVGFGAAGTVVFELASDAAAAIATDGSATEHLTSQLYNAANPLPAGTVIFKTPLPSEGPVYERYLGLLQQTGANALTAGAVDAFLTLDVAKWKSYNDSI